MGEPVHQRGPADDRRWTVRRRSPGQSSRPRLRSSNTATVPQQKHLELHIDGVPGNRSARPRPASRGDRSSTSSGSPSTGRASIGARSASSRKTARPGQPALLRGDRRPAGPGGDRQAAARRGPPGRRRLLPGTRAGPRRLGGGAFRIATLDPRVARPRRTSRPRPSSSASTSPPCPPAAEKLLAYARGRGPRRLDLRSERPAAWPTTR